MKIKTICRHEIVYKKRQVPVGNPLYTSTHPQNRFARHFGRAALLGQRHGNDSGKLPRTRRPARSDRQHAGELSQEDSKAGSIGYSRNIRHAFRDRQKPLAPRDKSMQTQRFANIPASKILQQNGRHHIPQNAETFKKRILKLQLTRS